MRPSKLPTRRFYLKPAHWPGAVTALLEYSMKTMRPHAFILLLLLACRVYAESAPAPVPRLQASTSTPAPAGVAPDQSAQSGKGEENLFLDPSFESGEVTEGIAGALLLKPAPGLLWDASGSQARTGVAALKLRGDEGLVCRAPAQAGESYRLSCWMRGMHNGAKGRMQINWQRADASKLLIKYELEFPTLTTAYQKFEIVGKAPPETYSALLIFTGGGPNIEVWLDDVFFGKVLPSQ